MPKRLTLLTAALPSLISAVIKKRVFIALALLSQATTGLSQFDFQLGKISADEANLKECVFDPEAEAAVLIDAGSSNYDDEYKLITYQHTRIKILKQRGMECANVSIPYHSANNKQYVDDVVAMTINIDENGNRQEYKLDKRSIYFRKINNELSEVTFAFPEAKVGSILEYRYRIISEHYGWLADWAFQSRLPVYTSSYNLRIVPNLEITFLIQKNAKYKVISKQNTQNNSVFFQMKDIPGLGNEPYIDARRDYIQKVIFQMTKYHNGIGNQNYMSTWSEVTRELFSNNVFGKQLKNSVEECEDFIKTTVKGKPDLAKMKLVHEYVQKNISWNGDYSLTCDEGVKTVWNKRKGSSGSVNILLINLLKTAGLEVSPMLVSERGNGMVNKSMPFISQFNNVYAAVLINGRPFYLDATDKYTPCHLIPFSILNTTAFIVNNKGGGLIDIAEPEIRRRDLISISARLKEDGELSGRVGMTSLDYARIEKLRNYKTDEKNYAENYIAKGLVNITLDSLKLENEETDSLPLKQAFNYKTNVQSTGDYSFVTLNMFTGFEENPFIINERFSKINFGYKTTTAFSYAIQLPDNYTVEGIPKNITMVNADKTLAFSRQLYYAPESGQLLARIKIDLNKSLYEVEEYPEIKDFYKKMTDLLNEQVVLKKK